MGRRRPQSEQSAGGSWMDTYGDLVTLLLTFFVLLYSFSSIDAAKWEALVNSLSRNGRAVSPGAGGVSSTGIGNMKEPPQNSIEIPDFVSDVDGEPGDPEDPAPTAGPGGMPSAAEPSPSVPPTTTTVRPVTPTPRATPKPTVNGAMSDFYRDMQRYLNTTPLAGSVSLEQKGSQLLIRLRVSLIFEPGSDKLKPEAQQILNEAAAIIRKNLSLVKSLRTEGHTDSVTPPVGSIESKWELAALRAARVMQQIVNRTGIDQGKVYTVGYGSARPVASNSSEDGRNRNNRVDIIVAN